MYCVIQQVQRKKPDTCGGYREIRAYPLEMSINGVSQVPVWKWEWSGGRFERPHLDAYKITLHQSYREGGIVKKRQYAVCTMSYYDICESWFGDFIIGGENALAKKLGMDPAEVCEIVEAKLTPLRERLEADFQQSEEYQTNQKHEQILRTYREAKTAFCEKYGVNGDEYDRCYDVFGTLRNSDYLKQLKQEHKARQQARRRQRQSYRETFERFTSGGGYSAALSSTYTADETAILKQFYRLLSKTYHPDLNPGKDTTQEMQLLNRLKQQWGV